MSPRLNGVVETALYVEDLDRSVEWYTRVMGFRRIFDGGDRLQAMAVADKQVLLLFRKGASTGVIEVPGGRIPSHGGDGHLHLAFAVDGAEISSWREHFAKEKVPIASEVKWGRRGGVCIFMIRMGMWWRSSRLGSGRFTNTAPVAEYLRTSYEPYCEYVDGELRPRQPHDDQSSNLLATLVFALSLRDKPLGLRVRPSRHIRISPTRFRVPSIAVFTQIDKQEAATTPPLLTVEIVTPGETWSGLIEGVHDHLAMGVGNVIIADAQARTVSLATRQQPLRQLTAPLKISIEVLGRGVLEIDFDQVFVDMD